MRGALLPGLLFMNLLNIYAITSLVHFLKRSVIKKVSRYFSSEVHQLYFLGNICSKSVCFSSLMMCAKSLRRH